MARPKAKAPASLDMQAAALLGQHSPQAVASFQAKQPTLIKHITTAFREHAAENYANHSPGKASQ